MSAYHSKTLKLIAFASGTLLFCGCGEPTATAPVADIQPVSMSTSPDTSVSPNADKISDVSVAGKLSSKLPESIAEPIDETENYFAPPQDSAPLQQVVSTGDEKESVRLLGFVAVHSNGANDRRAILKIGESSLLMSVGDNLKDIELLEIGERTVTLQRNRERWTLGLYDQPIVNKAAGSTANSNRVRRPQTNAPRPSAPVTPSVVALPEAAISPQVPSPMEIKLPEMPMPTMPDLSKLLPSLPPSPR